MAVPLWEQRGHLDANRCDQANVSRSFERLVRAVCTGSSSSPYGQFERFVRTARTGRYEQSVRAVRAIHTGSPHGRFEQILRAVREQFVRESAAGPPASGHGDRTSPPAPQRNWSKPAGTLLEPCRNRGETCRNPDGALPEPGPTPAGTRARLQEAGFFKAQAAMKETMRKMGKKLKEGWVSGCAAAMHMYQ